MNKTIRIRTTPLGNDRYIQVPIEQDFDFVQILSLKISQEDIYFQHCADYGVLVGRITVNGGYGVPNARVSIFIPLSEDDESNPVISSMYPFKKVSDKNHLGVRYNLLPKQRQNRCHVPVGTFPSKREVLDNNDILEIFEKYYKYTTTTNESGDYMICGIPVGPQTVHIDVDLSDIGVLSQKPHDMIRNSHGVKASFDTPTKCKEDADLDKLPQIITDNTSIDIKPFCGDKDVCGIGINRYDMDLPYRVEPVAYFIGSIMSDTEKNSINKHCRPRRKLGNVCEMVTGEGTIEIIRRTMPDKNGAIHNEYYSVDGNRVIDADGTWVLPVPMNTEYIVTDEYGNVIKSEDPRKGVPTETRCRFRVSMDVTGGEGRLRTRAKYLVPNNPPLGTTGDYTFGDETKDINNNFTTMKWNNIYTVRNYIPRIQRGIGPERRSFIGLKNVDDCETYNPFPFNRMDSALNLLFVILCDIMTIISKIIFLINAIVIMILNAVVYILNRIIQAICEVIWWLANPHFDFNWNQDYFQDIDWLPTLHIHININVELWKFCYKAWCIAAWANPDNYDPSLCDSNTPAACQCVDAIGYIPCISVQCGEEYYQPGCYFVESVHATWENDYGIEGHNPVIAELELYENCLKTQLADALNVFKFDFYNDWINGTLYPFLIKYKEKRSGKRKYCAYDCEDLAGPSLGGNHHWHASAIVPGSGDGDGDGVADNSCWNTYNFDVCDFHTCDLSISVIGGLHPECGSENLITPAHEFIEGLIKRHNSILYYASTTHYGDVKLFATDITLLGNINECNAEGIPVIWPYLTPTTYQLPPPSPNEGGGFGINMTGFYNQTYGEDGVTCIDPLLMSLTCRGADMIPVHCRNVRLLCELGRGLDEDRLDPIEVLHGTAHGRDGLIDQDDIENEYVRTALRHLNVTGVTGTEEFYHNAFRGFNSSAGVYGFGDAESSGVHSVGWPSEDPTISGNTMPYGLPYNNSYYFYFGLVDGSTALDKLRTNYLTDCDFPKTNDFFLTYTASSVTTYLGHDGTISIEAIGGSAPYSAEITSSVPTTQQLVTTPVTFNDVFSLQSNYIGGGLMEGDYTITVTDANGWVATITVSIIGPNPLTFTLGGSNPHTHNATDGELYITNITGGQDPYTIVVADATTLATVATWVGNSGNCPQGCSHTFTGLGAGDYKVTVTDSSSPVQTFVKFFTLTEPSMIVLTLTNQVNLLCNGSPTGSYQFAVAGGQSPYTINVAGPNGYVGTTFGGTNLAGGTYTAVVTDHLNQTATLAVVLTEPSPLTLYSSNTATHTGYHVSCFGGNNGTITLNAAGGVPPYTYKKGSTDLGTVNTVYNLYAGTAMFSVIDTNGCTTTLSTSINEPPALVISNIPLPDPYNDGYNISCNGGTANITVYAAGGAGAIRYSVDGGAYQTSNVLTGLYAGSHTFTIKDDNACTTSQTINLTQPTALGCTAVPGTPGATMTPVTFTASGGVGGQPNQYFIDGVFPMGGGGYNVVTIPYPNGGTYTATLTDAHGCSKVTLPFTV